MRELRAPYFTCPFIYCSSFPSFSSLIMKKYTHPKSYHVRVRLRDGKRVHAAVQPMSRTLCGQTTSVPVKQAPVALPLPMALGTVTLFSVPTNGTARRTKLQPYSICRLCLAPSSCRNALKGHLRCSTCPGPCGLHLQWNLMKTT